MYLNITKISEHVFKMDRNVKKKRKKIVRIWQWSPNYDFEDLWILGSSASLKEGVRFQFISVNVCGRSGYTVSEQMFRHTGPCQWLPQASTKLRSKIIKMFKPEPSQPQILNLSLNPGELVQVKLFRLEPARARASSVHSEFLKFQLYL